MKQEIKDLIVNQFNQGLLSKANAIFAEKMGYEANFKLEENYYRHCGFVLSLIETGNGSTEALTSSPLLRAMFESAKVEGDVYYTEEDGSIFVRFGIQYEHPSGGSNGLRLFDVIFNTNTGDVTIR